MSLSVSQLKSDLQSGLPQMGISASVEQLEQLITFTTEFYRWNQVHNLSAIENYQDFISANIFDSLSVVSPMRKVIAEKQIKVGGQIADLGAGGGFPSMLLAIFIPEVSFVLVESVRKKAAFLSHVKGRLQLQNVSVVDQRIEDFSAVEPHTMDATISRAFSELKNFIHFSEPLLRPGGIILAMKSQKAELEISRLESDWEVIENIELKVPKLDAFRCLLLLRSMRKYVN